MRRLAVGCAVLLLVGALGVVEAGALVPVASGPPLNVTLVHKHPHKDCDGDHDTLTWSPPVDTGEGAVTGYHVTQLETGADVPHVYNFELGPDVTSLAVVPHVGWVYFSVYAETEEGWSDDSTISLFTDGPPSAQSFDFTYDLDVVKPRSITTSASWFEQTKVPGLGGNPTDSTVTITISPGGESHRYQAQGAGVGVPVTFRHLAVGTEYHFTAVVENKCGSATSFSPAFTTGTEPQWIAASPSLSAALSGRYRYRFHAKGTPNPTYALSFDVPEWLSINPETGLVSGKPPSGTESFSYSVFASSPFGIEALPHSIVAGPFDVSVATNS